MGVAWLGRDVSASPPLPGDKLLADLSHRWQGVWIVRDADYPGSVQAWNVTGDHVSVYDAKQHHVDDEKFALVSPCRVSRSLVVDGKQQAIVTSDTFVFASDGLHVARAPAAGGFQQGAIVDACIGDDVYEYDTRAGSCERLPVTGSAPPLTDRAECSLDHGLVSTSFVVRSGGGGTSTRLDFYGGALLSQPLLAHIAEHRPTFVGAVRRADALAH
jgi:hypothetical protein